MSKNPYSRAQAQQSQGVGSSGEGKKVVVAMSGGVDSSVAALLLKQQGYEVVGIALQVTDYSKFRDADSQSTGSCCSIKDMEDARRVAESLQIPFYVLDTEQTFDANVVDYFINEYLQGRTPNPCVMCNSKVKFNHLYKKAMDMGADFIATGHYAKLSHEASLGATLWKPRDLQKDQTYFLFNLTQRQLEKTLFPLGHLTKTEVRELAEKFNIPVAQKPDSQEICFVPSNDYSRFIASRVAPTQRKAGFVVDQFDNVLCEHDGLYKFTIGQRKGLGEALEMARKIGHADAAELCVIKIDPIKNRVVLGTDKDLNQWGFVAARVNWIVPPDLRQVRRLQVKIRSRAEPADCEVRMLGDQRVEVRFVKPQRAVTPGQAAVFYDNNMCLGGGWIMEPIKVKEEDRPRVGAGGAEVLSV